MIVAGLDLSLRSTGLVAVSDEFATSLDWTTVVHRLVVSDSLPQGASVRERTGRLLTIAGQVSRWVESVGADMITLEMQAYRMRHAHARELGELTGIVCAELLTLNLPIVMVTASAARKTLLGSVPRKGAKDAVDALLHRMGAPWTDTDRSDAFAVANHVLSISGMPFVTVGKR